MLHRITSLTYLAYPQYNLQTGARLAVRAWQLLQPCMTPVLLPGSQASSKVQNTTCVHAMACFSSVALHLSPSRRLSGSDHHAPTPAPERRSEVGADIT